MDSVGNSNNKPRSPALSSRIVNLFLRTNLTPLAIGFSIIIGTIAVFLTSREEEPQIVVPMADIHVSASGLAVEEVERQVATPLEKLLNQIDGVEHVYSVATPGRAVVTVRFYVGENREDSLVKIYNKIYSNTDLIPPDVESWIVKPIEIDDVPIINITLWSDRPEEVDDYALRRIAEEVEIEIKGIRQTNRTQIIGGRKRVLRVDLDSEALATQKTSVLDVVRALQLSNVRKLAGGFDQNNQHITVDVGDFFEGVNVLRHAVVNVVDGRAVFLKDVANISDGPEEQTGYTWIGFGQADTNSGPHNSPGNFFPAVHIAVAKQKGANAVWVADRVKAKIEELASTHFPAGIHARITRDYGETANDKINELLKALGVALIIVVGLITYSLGWREGLVVATAVPIAFSLTLLINYWAGYTINRVTLFALILSLGLVVDDPIVDIENIYRHLRMRLESPLQAVRTAVNEVRPPILLATLAVIVSFLPLTLITGMMGPYMRPLALNVPVAMLMSMFVAFAVTPWLAYKVLRGQADKLGNLPENPVKQSALYRFYAAALNPLLERDAKAWGLLLLMVALFSGAAALAMFRLVPLKMLPFDNKNELQILVNPAEGTTLEQTDAITRQLAEVLRRAPEVRDFENYVGLSSAMDFNGMTRHYYLRNAPHVADIRVNLTRKEMREMQSHQISMRLRHDLESVAKQYHARIAIVETPPGPPVLSTITAEIYGNPGISYNVLRSAARNFEMRLMAEPGVSDVDSTVEDDAERLLFSTDREKAALSGVSVSDIAQTAALSLSGLDVTRLHEPGEVNPLSVRLRLPRDARSSLDRLRGLVVKGQPGIVKTRESGGTRDAPIPIVRLGELGVFETLPMEKAIYHKDLQPVVFVYAEAVGRAPAEIVADVEKDRLDAITPGSSPPPRPLVERTYFSNGGGIPWALPNGTRISWFGEGELNITRDVFRDLGIAFAAALVCIYLILIYQTKSYRMPLVLMISIPLSLIGVLPGFWLLNKIAGEAVAGYENPIFFTATAMIGMIAVSGLAVRNAILLIEFLHTGLTKGLSLRDATLEAGAVRIRAILLTSGTAMLSAIPIAFDPVFSGLAWALIFGLLVSTVFTLFVIPVAYNLMYRNLPGHGLPVADEE